MLLEHPSHADTATRIIVSAFSKDKTVLRDKPTSVAIFNSNWTIMHTFSSGRVFLDNVCICWIFVKLLHLQNPVLWMVFSYVLFRRSWRIKRSHMFWHTTDTERRRKSMLFKTTHCLFVNAAALNINSRLLRFVNIICLKSIRIVFSHFYLLHQSPCYHSIRRFHSFANEQTYKGSCIKYQE